MSPIVQVSMIIYCWTNALLKLFFPGQTQTRATLMHEHKKYSELSTSVKLESKTIAVQIQI